MSLAAYERIASFVSACRILTCLDGTRCDARREGRARLSAREEVFAFEEATARYVKFEALNTAGAASGWPEYRNAPVNIAELTVFPDSAGFPPFNSCASLNSAVLPTTNFALAIKLLRGG